MRGAPSAFAWLHKRGGGRAPFGTLTLRASAKSGEAASFDLLARKVNRAATLSAINQRSERFRDPTRASPCLRAHPDGFKRPARFLLSRLLSRPLIHNGRDDKNPAFAGTLC